MSEPTMALPRLMHDPNGNRVPFGKITKTLEWNSLDGALPSWLTVASGTSTITSPPSAALSGISVASGTTIGNTAELQTLAIDTTNLRAIIWTCEGLTWSHDDGTVEPKMGIYTDPAPGVGGGVALYHPVASSFTRIGLYKVNATQGTPQTNYTMRDTDIAKHSKNLTMVLLPQSKWLYVMEDDQVAYSRSLGTDIAWGQLRGRIVATTQTAAARSFSVQQVRLQLVSN